MVLTIIVQSQNRTVIYHFDSSHFANQIFFIFFNKIQNFWMKIGFSNVYIIELVRFYSL